MRHFIHFPALALCLGWVVSCQVPAHSEASPKPEMVQDATSPLAEAQTAAEQGNFDRALFLLDSADATLQNTAKYQTQYARWSFALFQQALQTNSLDGATMDGLLQDAIFAAETSLEISDLPSTRILLSEVLRTAGRPTEAWDLTTHLRQAPQTLPPSFVFEMGKVALSLTADAVRAGDSLPAASDEGVTLLEQAARAMPEASLSLADLHTWCQRAEAARRVLIQTMIEHPSFVLGIQKLKSMGPSDPIATAKAFEEIRLAHPQNAQILWYTGEARYFEARYRRDISDFLRCHEALDRAEECFHLARTLNPSYQNTCRSWLHILRTQHGWAYRQEGQVDAAAQAFLHALKSDPQLLEPESTPDTLRLGFDAIIWDYFTAGGGNDRRPSLQRLNDGRIFLHQLLALHDQNPSWFNNLGFACRDLGTQAQAEGNNELASSLFAESWDAYTKTVALSPNDVRLINDRALISIYYLGREWETAVQELHRALALGNKQLAELSENVSPAERQLLDEAIGDAWENLAYHNLVNLNSTAEVENYLNNSSKHYPFHNRDGVLRLRKQLSALKASTETAPH